MSVGVQTNTGRTHFKKGCTPWNKGKEHPIKHDKQFRKGYIPWNKGMKGLNAGEKNPTWRGEATTYSPKHSWVRRMHGRPGECVHCGKENAKNGRSIIQWANVDHKYSRKLEDYIPLCYNCHGQYDMVNHLRKRKEQF